jgi:hypothetical protein
MWLELSAHSTRDHEVASLSAAQVPRMTQLSVIAAVLGQSRSPAYRRPSTHRSVGLGWTLKQCLGAAAGLKRSVVAAVVRWYLVITVHGRCISMLQGSRSLLPIPLRTHFCLSWPLGWCTGRRPDA